MRPTNNMSLHITHRGTLFQSDEPAIRVACFPALVETRGGRVLCLFRVASSKDSADETLKLLASDDEGANWQELPFAPNTHFNGVQGGWRMGKIIETQPNELLVLGNWVNHENPDLPISHPETAGCLEMKLCAFRSPDGGQSWSEAEEILSPFPQPELSGSLIALSEPGHFLVTMENQKFYDDPAPIDERAYVLISRDYGKSWGEWATVAHDFPHRKFWCNRAEKLPSGKLIVVSWTFDEQAQCDLPLHFVHGSSDGKEWSAPVSSDIEGQVSELLALDESTLLMATSHRETPAGIRLRQSFDGGETWEKDGFLVFDAENQAADSGGDLADYYNQMTAYTFGWSPMVRLKNGDVLTAYWAGNEDAIAMYWARIALDK